MSVALQKALLLKSNFEHVAQVTAFELRAAAKKYFFSGPATNALP